MHVVVLSRVGRSAQLLGLVVVKPVGIPVAAAVCAARHHMDGSLSTCERISVRVRAPIIVRITIWIRLVMTRNVGSILPDVRVDVVVALRAAERRRSHQHQHNVLHCCHVLFSFLCSLS
jgi:hypothetical protein